MRTSFSRRKLYGTRSQDKSGLNLVVEILPFSMLNLLFGVNVIKFMESESVLASGARIRKS
jgi:hypothetical protein